MQVEFICVGKLKETYLKDACNEYAKRLSRFCKLTITELKDEAIEEYALEREEERILSKISPRDYVISLCIEGKEKSSVEFAKKITEIEQLGSGRLIFIIGGSWGLSEQVKLRSDFKLSFSPMTFPHQLMRVILLEQLYRAYKINANESYHK